MGNIAKRRRTFEDVVWTALDTFREKYRAVRDGMPKLMEEFEWKRKKWRQWKEHDQEFAKRKGGKGTDSNDGGVDGSSYGKGWSKGNSKDDGKNTGKGWDWERQGRDRSR